MNLRPFADYVQSHLTSQKVYVFNMPHDQKIGILLLQGFQGAKRWDELPQYRKAEFQVIVRHTNYEAGYALAKSVEEVLDIRRLTLTSSVGNLYVHHATPCHDPVSYPRSSGDVIEFSIRFETAYVQLI